MRGPSITRTMEDIRRHYPVSLPQRWPIRPREAMHLRHTNIEDQWPSPRILHIHRNMSKPADKVTQVRQGPRPLLETVSK